MGEQCNIQTNFSEIFETKLFQDTRAIKFGHEVPLRYGYTNNITAVIAGDGNDSDYLKGLLASSITCFCFFLCWTLALWIMKCLGPEKVGGLSGRMKALPSKPVESSYNSSGEGDDNTKYKQDVEEWTQRYQRTRGRLNMARVAVVFAGLSIIVSAILMSIYGVESLVKSMESGRDTITIVQNLTHWGINLIDTALDSDKAALDQISRLLPEFNTICPEIREEICSDMKDSSTCNWEGLEDIFDRELFTSLLDHLESARDDLYEELVESKSDLEDMILATENLVSTAKTYNWAFQVARVFGLVLACLCSIIIHGVVFRMSRATKWLEHWILVPSFVVLVVLCFAFSLVFIIGSTSLADLCVDSPDTRMLVLLDRFRESLSPLVYAFMVFYISQCPRNNIPPNLEKQIRFFLEIIARVRRLGEGLIASSDKIQEVCGLQEPPKGILQIAEITSEQLCVLADLLADLRQYLECRNWHPLYTTTLYDAMCYSGTDGFAWVSITQMLIVFMAMIIVTARVAFYNIEISDVANEDEIMMENEHAPNGDPGKLTTFNGDLRKMSSVENKGAGERAQNENPTNGQTHILIRPMPSEGDDGGFEMHNVLGGGR